MKTNKRSTFTNCIRTKSFRYSKFNQDKKNHKDKNHQKCFDCCHNASGWCKNEKEWAYLVDKKSCKKIIV